MNDARPWLVRLTVEGEQLVEMVTAHDALEAISDAVTGWGPVDGAAVMSAWPAETEGQR